MCPRDEGKVNMVDVGVSLIESVWCVPTIVFLLRDLFKRIIG